MAKYIMQADKQQLLREHYELIRVLGEGSFGKVYLIRNRKTKKQYALKRYNRSHLEKRNKYKTLIRSILILQSLRHPAIIKFVNYIVSPDQTTIYLLFECCKKGSLEKIKRVLLQNGQTRLIKYVLFQLADALQYIKSMNMAHRDIKPPNITFNSEGQLKLIDFDQAVCFDQRFSNLTQSCMVQDFGINLNEVVSMLNSRKSRASSFVGTMIYMSPEMIHSTIGDEKGDLWAYGCIVYEMLVGEYLHIECEGQQQFQEQLEKRLAIMRQKNIDQGSIEFFTSIAQFNPRDRLDIDSVSEHQFFDQIRGIKQLQQCRKGLARLLRGNHALLKKETLDACQIEGIGMPIGKEIFEHLVTVVLVRGREGYEFYHLIGGPRYFKLKHIKEPSVKVYLHYHEIDGIEMQGKEIIVRSTRKNKKEEIAFKHLYPQMLHPLFQLMTTIFRD